MLAALTAAHSRFRSLAGTAAFGAALLSGCHGGGDGAEVPAAVGAEKACAALDGKTIAGASLVATTVSGIGPTPTFCRVNGTIAPKLNFELHLPEHWNGKLHYAGGGGYNGSIPPLAGAPLTALKQGYATVSSDSGHQASAVDASFALKDANAAQLFGSPVAIGQDKTFSVQAFA